MKIDVINSIFKVLIVSFTRHRAF